jgi:putative endopeptidase
MKKLLCLLIPLVVLSGCSRDDKVAAPAEPKPAPLASGVKVQNFDKSVRAQDDFYRHVNGQWLTVTPIPSDRSNYGTFTMLEDGAEHDMRQILEEAAGKPNRAPGSDEQKAGDFFGSFMDEAAIESRGLAPLEEDLKRIQAIASKKDLAAYLGYAQRIGVPQPFVYFVAIDEKNSTQYVGTLYQTGIGMPDRDYYLSSDAQLKAVRDKYRVYIKDLLAAAQTPNAEASARKIYALEERLAKAQWTQVQNRDAEKTYNRYEAPALAKLMPGFDWSAFFSGAQIPADHAKALIISQPSYFEGLGKAINDVPLDDWRTYLRYQLLNTYAPDLPKQIVDLNFDFYGKAVSGTQEIRPRWKRGVNTVENAIGDLVGKVYVERHFKPDAKQRMDALVGNLQAAFAAGIDALEWMTPETKQKAHAKLDKFTTKIGYPEKWRDWSKLEVRRDDLVGNEMRAASVVFDRHLGKLGGPIDKTEWLMTPQTVNAYYNPPANEIVFPAAILQPPFFDVTADDAINYGAIGAVIGHEVSHGFDDQGRRYDGDGNLNDWWAPKDNEEFLRRTKALGEQYGAAAPLPGQKLNPDLTMGENIADVAGLTMAYRAYKLSLKGQEAPVIDGYTGDQRFFIGWAQGWARKYRDDELRRRLLTDPHSPSEYRCNIVVANLDAFQSAFDLKPGDKMYREPTQRVKIW